jgi:hypothetical protein
VARTVNAVARQYAVHLKTTQDLPACHLLCYSMLRATQCYKHQQAALHPNSHLQCPYLPFSLSICPLVLSIPLHLPRPGTSQDSPLFYARLFGLLTPQASLAAISLILAATRIPADLARTQPNVTYARLASMEVEVVGRLTGARWLSFPTYNLAITWMERHHSCCMM